MSALAFWSIEWMKDSKQSTVTDRVTSRATGQMYNYSFYCNQGPRMNLKDFKYTIDILLKDSVQNRD